MHVDTSLQHHIWASRVQIEQNEQHLQITFSSYYPYVIILPFISYKIKAIITSLKLRISPIFLFVFPKHALGKAVKFFKLNNDALFSILKIILS